MSRVRVAVLDDYQEVAASCADWDRLDCDVSFFARHLSGEEAAQELAGYDVVVAMRERTPFDRQLIAALDQLQLLITTGTRNASFDLAAAAEREITVCGTRSPGHATAELAFALIQSLARNLSSETTSVRSGGWQAGVGRDLRGARLGIVGLGRLGRQVAGFGEAFGMDVVAWSENLGAGAASEAGARLVSFAELLATSDFVTVHLRLSDRTVGLIGETELATMQPEAYLVNTSRAAIVDDSALLSAVREGRIAGAAIDVYSEEPLPADHPLRLEPRILATPHIGYVTRETYEVFYGDAVENIEAWLAGAPIRLIG